MSTTVLPFTLTIITIYYSDTIYYISIDFLVYTVCACLKGVTPNKTLKEEPTNKHYVRPTATMEQV